MGCYGGVSSVTVLNIKARFYQPTVTHLGDYAPHAGEKLLVAFVLLMGAQVISAESVRFSTLPSPAACFVTTLRYIRTSELENHDGPRMP